MNRAISDRSYQFRGLLNLANDACCFFEQVGVNPKAGSSTANVTSAITTMAFSRRTTGRFALI